MINVRRFLQQKRLTELRFVRWNQHTLYVLSKDPAGRVSPDPLSNEKQGFTTSLRPLFATVTTWGCSIFRLTLPLIWALQTL